MNRRIILNEDERSKILSMHRNEIKKAFIREDDDTSGDEFMGDDTPEEMEVDLNVEKFGPLVSIEGNGEKFMGSEIDGGWEFYNNEDVIVTMDEMCSALSCSMEQLKDTLGIDDESEEIDDIVISKSDDDETDLGF
jgi:hypothetical protein